MPLFLFCQHVSGRRFNQHSAKIMKQSFGELIKMSVGSLVSIADFGVLPENVTVFTHVDQIAVLKKADVFVTHCGMKMESK